MCSGLLRFQGLYGSCFPGGRAEDHEEEVDWIVVFIGGLLAIPVGRIAVGRLF